MNFVMLAVSTLIALGGFVGFESTIASYGRHVEALGSEISADERMLQTHRALEQAMRQTRAQMRDLHLLDPAREQVALTFRELAGIAKKRGVEIVDFRHQHFPAAQLERRSETVLGSDELDVTLQGRYAALLETLADLSQSPLVTQTAMAAFERSGERLRASLSLTVYRLNNRNVRDD